MVRSRLTDLTAGATIKVMPGEIALPRSPHDEIRLASVEQSVGALLSPTLTTFVYDRLGRLREQLQWTNSSSGGGDVLLGPGGGANPDLGGGSWGLSGGTLYIYDGKRVIQRGRSVRQRHGDRFLFQPFAHRPFPRPARERLKLAKHVAQYDMGSAGLCRNVSQTAKQSLINAFSGKQAQSHRLRR
jgi:hypothetical protein